MRELKIFFVVLIFTGIVYWGVEPFAHSQMNPKVSPANFDFAKADNAYFTEEIKKANQAIIKAKENLSKASDKKSANEALEKAKASLKANEKNLKEYDAMWLKANKIATLKGDAALGKEIFGGNCIACHGLEIDGLPAPIPDSSGFGVTPPDLSDAAHLYNRAFLAAFIMHPAKAYKTTHKFNDNNPLPMPDYPLGEDAVQDNTDIANLLAYLDQMAIKYEKDFDEKTKAKLKEKYKKAPNSAELVSEAFIFEKEKNAYTKACGHCHDMKYDNYISKSTHKDLASYLGMTPPDLSMIIRAKGEHYLNIFINEPQKLIHGTAMPRVGLNQASQEKIISYMEKVGDSKKAERESLGIYMMIFFAILSVFAYGWKRSVWSKLH